MRAFVSRWVLHALFFCFALIVPGVVSAESICAEVKIEIKQSVTLERQAFDAVLRVRNGLTLPVTDLRVELKFMDANGDDVPAVIGSTAPAGERFFYRTDGHTEMSAHPGAPNGPGAVVAGGKTGEARWLIVPTAIAGGELPSGRVYRVGASITYKLDSGSGTPETRSVEVAPDTIVVKPQPKVRLDYFLPHDVYGDDTQTGDIVEPMVPFTLGVRVWNYGHGPARSLKIETAQPAITENDQGFPVEFAILDGYVDDAPAQPSLTIGFGDVAPSTARMGRWNMTASFSGQFDEFTATLRHADEFGGALTAIIDESEVWTHRLVRDVLADLPGRDGIKDFLALDGQTVRLYESDGGLVHVPGTETSGSSVVTERVPTATVGAASATLRVMPSLNNFIYARYEVDEAIAAGKERVTAVRSGGKVLPAANAWFSKERDTSGDRWIYYINVFDYHEPALGAGEVVYTLGYGETPTQPASLRGAVYDDVDGNGVRDAGEPALFDALVTLNGLDANGQAVQAQARTDVAGEYAFAGLEPGSYRVAVADVPGYRNGIHTVGSAGGLLGQDAISHIALASGANATGYTFAKIPLRPDATSGDLSLTQLTSNTQTPTVGQIFKVTIAVGNAGPDAVPGAVRVSLPPSATLVATGTSYGSFDDATSTWDIGPVAVGATPSIVLQLTMPAPGAFSIGAVVAVNGGADVVDPALGNNEGTLALEAVEPPALAFEASTDRRTNLLVLSGCVPIVPNCDATRPAELEAMFGAIDIGLKVVNDDAAFLAELRSGQWNTFWISSGAGAKLQQLTMLELSQAVLNGQWLIVDNPRGDSNLADMPIELLEALMPVTYNGDETKASAYVTAGVSTWLPAFELPTEGVRNLYQTTASNAEVLAWYGEELPDDIWGIPGLNPPKPAIIQVNRTIVTGFDFFTTLSGADPTVREDVLTRLLRVTRPPVPTTYMAGDYVDVVASASNPNAPLTAWLQYGLPAGSTFAAAAPAPYDRSNGVAWTRTLSTPQSFVALAGVHLPTTAGTHTIRAQIRRDNASGDALATPVDLSYTVVDADAQIAVVRPLVVAAQAQQPGVVAMFDEAITLRAGGMLEDAIIRLLEMSAELDDAWRYNADYDSPLPHEFGRLLRVLQREWYAGLMVCGLGGPEETPFLVGQGRRTTSPSGAVLYARNGNMGGGSPQAEWFTNYLSRGSMATLSIDRDWTSGAEYDWGVTYFRLSTVTSLGITPLDGGASEMTTCSLLAGPCAPLLAGDVLEIQSGIAPGVTGVTITTTMGSVNDFPLLSLTLAPGQGTTPRLVTRYLYVPQLLEGLDVSGRTSITYTGTPPSNTDAVFLRIRPISYGNVCRRLVP